MFKGKKINVAILLAIIWSTICVTAFATLGYLDSSIIIGAAQSQKVQEPIWSSIQIYKVTLYGSYGVSREWIANQEGVHVIVGTNIFFFDEYKTGRLIRVCGPISIEQLPVYLDTEGECKDE